MEERVVDPYKVLPEKLNRKLFEEYVPKTEYQIRLKRDILIAIDVADKMKLDQFDMRNGDRLINDLLEVYVVLWFAWQIQHGIVAWNKIFAETKDCPVGIISEKNDFRVERIPGSSDFRIVPTNSRESSGF